MTFLYPSFLWVLFALAIPVIIHLFNFQRYKKVYFTNVKYLKELYQETRSRSRLKEILILAARCLVLASLVFAFAQPVIPGEKSQRDLTGQRAVGIYIDNSFSMENVTRQGQLLEVARSKAKELVNAFSGKDRFHLLTNDFEGRHQRFFSRENMLKELDEIRISPAVKNLSDAVKRQSEFLMSSGNRNRRIYVLTDAQKSTFDIENLKGDTLTDVSVIPLNPNKVNNVFVDSCWFESPLQQKGFIQKLNARIVNRGTADIEAGSARLFLGGTQIAIASFSIGADHTKEIVFSFESRKSGFNFGSVRIEDYPVVFDDELFFTFNSETSISVCLINGKEVGKTSFFSSLFANDSLFRFSLFDERAIDYKAFRTSDVLILNQIFDISSGLLSEISKFGEQGGAILIVPPATGDIESFNRSLPQLNLPALGEKDTTTVKTEKINIASGFFTGVFEKHEDRLNLPIVNAHYRLLKTSRSEYEPLFTLLNGDELLIRSNYGKSQTFLFTAPINDKYTNLGRHAIFVPSIYRICFSALKPLPLFYHAGANAKILVKGDFDADKPPHIRSIDPAKADFIPELRAVNNALHLFTRNQVDQPGFYIVGTNDTLLQPLAFNYSRVESDLEAYSREDLEQKVKEEGLDHVHIIAQPEGDLAKQVLMGEEGKKLWKIFIILALAFIVAEVLLLRLPD